MHGCAGLRTTMGNMLRQIVAPLHELSLTKDPFLLVSKQLVKNVSSQSLKHHLQSRIRHHCWLAA